MAKYTDTFLELAYMLNGNWCDYTEAVELAVDYIFKRPIPFYNNNPEDISIFKHKFIDNYLTQELGFETPDMFIGRLYNRLNVIMPKYTELYKTILLDLESALQTYADNETKEISESGTNGFTNTLTHGLKTDTTSSDSGEATRTDNLTNLEDRNLGNSRIETINAQQLISDEPNTTITSNAYASNLQKNEADNQWTGTDTGTVERTNTGTVKNVSSTSGSVNTTNSGNDTTRNDGEHEASRQETINRSGFNADKNKLLAEFRQNILNLDMDIINECRDLFMQIF